LPVLTTKPNAIEPLSQQIVQTQKIKASDPSSYKHLVYGDHKMQKNQKEFAHPYRAELE